MWLQIFVAVHTSSTVLGCLINLFLCHVALFHSPPIIRTYSIGLINTGLTNVGACISGLLLQQRIIPSATSIFYISYGPCSLLGAQFCFDVFGALLHFHTHALWLIFLSFAYRFHVMLRKEPSRWALQSVILLVYIPSFIQMMAMFRQEQDIEKMRKMLGEKFPEYNLTGLTVTGASDIFTFAPIYTLTHLTVISTPIMIGIQVFRRKIVRILKEKGVDLSSRTRNLHAQLLRTLSFQATVPLFYLVGVLCYFLAQFGVWSHPLLEFSITTTFLFVPILTPFSSFVFVTPYRHYVLSLVSSNKNIRTVGSSQIKLNPVSVIIE